MQSVTQPTASGQIRSSASSLGKTQSWSRTLLCTLWGETTENHCARPAETNVDSTESNVFDSRGRTSDIDEGDDQSPGPSTSSSPSISMEPSPAPSTTTSMAPSLTSTIGKEPSGHPTPSPSAAPVAPPTSEPRTVSSNRLETQDCVTPDEDGNFIFPYTDSLLVAFTYQIQGTIELSAATLRNDVLANLEKDMARQFVPYIFDISVCPEATTTTTALRARNGDGRRLEDIPGLENPNGSVVNGLQTSPPDQVLDGFQGLRCRTALFDGAARCYVLTGAFTLTGVGGDLDEAYDMVQEAVKRVLNDDQSLNDAHDYIIDIRYLEAAPDFEIDYEPVVGSITGDPSGGGNKLAEDGLLIPNWAWVVIGCSLMFLLLIGLLVFRRRSKGSFDDIRNPRLLALPNMPNSTNSNSSDSIERYMPSQSWRNATMTDDERAQIQHSLSSPQSNSNTSTPSDKRSYDPVSVGTSQGQSLMIGAFPNLDPAGLGFAEHIGSNEDDVDDDGRSADYDIVGFRRAAAEYNSEGQTMSAAASSNTNSSSSSGSWFWKRTMV